MTLVSFSDGLFFQPTLVSGDSWIICSDVVSCAFWLSFLLFFRRRVIQVYARGARILDGSYMTQELTFGTSSTEPGTGSDSVTVSAVSIADPFVLLKMSDGSIQLLVGGMVIISLPCI